MTSRVASTRTCSSTRATSILPPLALAVSYLWSEGAPLVAKIGYLEPLKTLGAASEYLNRSRYSSRTCKERARETFSGSRRRNKRLTLLIHLLV